MVSVTLLFYFHHFSPLQSNRQREYMTDKYSISCIYAFQSSSG